MTLAATARYALALSGIVGVLAAIAAVALIVLVIGSPDRVVLATNDGELSTIFAYVLQRIADAARALIRMLS